MDSTDALRVAAMWEKRSLPEMVRLALEDSTKSTGAQASYFVCIYASPPTFRFFSTEDAGQLSPADRKLILAALAPKIQEYRIDNQQVTKHEALIQKHCPADVGSERRLMEHAKRQAEKYELPLVTLGIGYLLPQRTTYAEIHTMLTLRLDRALSLLQMAVQAEL